MKSFVQFVRERRSKSGKTAIWDVTTLDGKPIGTVSWYASWRCYAFCPDVATVFEQECLRVIAAFCGTETNKHKPRAGRKD